MNKSLALVMALLVLAAPVLAQQTPDLDALLERYDPFGPRQQATSDVYRPILEAGTPAVADLVGRIVPDEQGGDLKVRYVLHEIAIHVCRPGAEEQRAAHAASLAAQLSQPHPPVARQFVLRQLQLVATADAVPAIAPLLADDVLGPDAAQALVAIGGEPAAAALRQAARGATPQRMTFLLGALGVLGDRASSAMIAQVADGPDETLRLVAVEALANAAAPEHMDVLRRLAGDASPAVRRKAIDSLLLAGERFARAEAPAGDRREAMRIFGELAGEDRPVHLRSAALRGLARVDAAAAMPAIAAAIQSDDPELVAAAQQIAVRAPGREVTAWWLERLEQTPDAGKARVLEVLAVRRDPHALPAVLAVARQTASVAAPAAIHTAGLIGGERVVGDLVALLAGTNAAGVSAIRTALTGMEGSGVDAALGAHLRRSREPIVRETLPAVLAARQATGQVEAILTVLGDAEAGVRAAAVEALGNLGGPEQLAVMVAFLRRSQDADELAVVEAALARAAGRAGEAGAAAILGGIDGASPQQAAALLRVLGRAGGAQALAAVRQATRNRDSQIRDAAIRTLSDWQDAAALDDLRAIVRDAETLTHKVLAMRGYIRLLETADLDDARRLARYLEALEIAPRPQEKTLVLGSLPAVRTPEALAAATALMDTPALSEAAAAAAARMAAGMTNTWPEQVEPVLRRVVESARSPATRREAQAALDLLGQRSDLITVWMLSGPHRVGGRGPQALFDMPFAPETNPGSARWQAIGGQSGVIQLDALLGGSNAVAYLRTSVWSPQARPARLEIGSDDGVKAWLNGENVHANNVQRGVTPGQDKVDVQLREGWNHLMLKVTQGSGGWGACARLVDRRTGRPWDDLKYDAARQPGETTAP